MGSTSKASNNNNNNNNKKKSRQEKEDHRDNNNTDQNNPLEEEDTTTTRKVLEHDTKSVTTSDLAFPPNLQRHQARPGAFAQQGINNSDNDNDNHSSFDTTDEQLDDDRNDHPTPAAAAVEQSPQQSNHDNDDDFLISATLVEDDEGRDRRRRRRRSKMTEDDDDDDIEESKPAFTYAEPLDEDFLNRRRISRRGIVILVISVLALVALSVGLTFALTSNSNPPSGEDDDEDDDALLANVNSAKDLRLMEDLRFASFHSIDYGWATTTNCQEPEWSDLVLTCGDSADDEDEAMTTLVVLGTNKPDEIICERRDSLRKQVLCFVDDDDEKRSFSGTILAACASNDPSNAILPLQAVMDQVEVSNCNSLVSEEPLEGGGTERVAQGDSYQWLSIGRFCGDNNYLTNFVCEEGNSLLLPQDDDEAPQQNFCHEFDTCQATKFCPAGNACQGSDQCNLITRGIQVSDPVLQCLMEQDPTNNQTFFEYNLDSFWEQSTALHDAHFDSTSPPEERLPTLIDPQ